MLRTTNAYHLQVHLKGETTPIPLTKPIPGNLIPVLDSLATSTGAKISYSADTVIHFNYKERK